MNLLEHHIIEVHSVNDITNDFTKHCGYIPEEPYLEIDMTYDCYGIVKRCKQRFWKSNWDAVKKQGYFLA